MDALKIAGVGILGALAYSQHKEISRNHSEIQKKDTAINETDKILESAQQERRNITERFKNLSDAVEDDAYIDAVNSKTYTVRDFMEMDNGSLPFGVPDDELRVFLVESEIPFSVVADDNDDIDSDKFGQLQDEKDEDKDVYDYRLRLVSTSVYCKINIEELLDEDVEYEFDTEDTDDEELTNLDEEDVGEEVLDNKEIRVFWVDYPDPASF